MSWTSFCRTIVLRAGKGPFYCIPFYSTQNCSAGSSCIIIYFASKWQTSLIFNSLEIILTWMNTILRRSSIMSASQSVATSVIFLLQNTNREYRDKKSCGCKQILVLILLDSCEWKQWLSGQTNLSHWLRTKCTLSI